MAGAVTSPERRVEIRKHSHRKMPEACVRCGSTKNVEEDHIIAQKDWGLISIKPSREKTLGDTEVRELVLAVEKVLDSARNRRFLCRGCHDYRHAREDALHGLEKALAQANVFKVSMWIFRLGIIEAFNTPELVLERGYKPYWDFPETRYSAWYPKIKLEKRGLLTRTIQVTLANEIVPVSCLAGDVDCEECRVPGCPCDQCKHANPLAY